VTGARKTEGLIRGMKQCWTLDFMDKECTIFGGKVNFIRTSKSLQVVFLGQFKKDYSIFDCYVLSFFLNYRNQCEGKIYHDLF